MLEINLQGKTALITGATGDLGGMIARTLARAGADTAIHAFSNKEKAGRLQQTLEEMGVRCQIVSGNVGDQEAVFHIKEELERGIGMPDIVVACATAPLTWLPVLEQKTENFESLFRSGVMQSVYLAQAFLPAMKEKGWGRFIGINSECAMQCFPTHGAYAAMKRGMDGVYRVLAKEVGPWNITVNQVAPGRTISERDRREHTERDVEYEKNVPLGHRVQDTDIANAVAFLASDLAANITGVYLPVCGGNVMPGI